MADDTHDIFNSKQPEKKINPAKKKFVILEGSKKIIIRFLLVFWLVSTVFLFLRIFLESLGSDPQAAFVTFIYVISNIFLLPFFGIFPHANTMQPGKPIFDGAAFTAIFCYTVLVLLAVAITYIVAKILKTEEQVDETVEKNNPVNPTEAENEIL